MQTTQHTPTRTDLSNALDFELSGTLAGYWAAVLRVVVGYWSKYVLG